MNSREVDLIQKAIDGSLSKREQARLEDLIEKDSDFRVAYNSHVAAFNALKRIKPAEPPAELHQDVMNAINHHRYPRAQQTPSFAAAIKQLVTEVRHSVRLRYVTGFVTGAVAACLLLGVMYDWPAIDSNDAGGTIGGSSQPAAAQQLFYHDFSFLGGSGSIELSDEGDHLIAEVDLNSQDQVQVRAHFSDETAAIIAVTQDPANTSRITIDAGSAVIIHQGNKRYTITAQKTAGNAPDFTLTIDDVSGGQLFSLPNVIAKDRPGQK